jgi:O-antigen/teichoic acid export membrane protein
MVRRLGISIVKKFLANQFLKNVTTLALGTVIAQAILVASTPILTRLYSAEDFGLLALFTSVSTIAAILTTGRYEYAIGLPEKDSDAKHILVLTLALGATVSFIYLIAVLFLRFFNGSSLYFELIHSPIVFMIPIYTFASASFSTLQYWTQRQKQYKQISISSTLQVTGATLFNVIFGLVGFKTFGLIFSLVIGQILSIFILAYIFYKKYDLNEVAFKGIQEKAKQYINFPKYMIVSDLSTAASQQMIPLVFATLFNSTVVGLFSLANRVLRTPSIVLTSSIGNVFRNDAIDAIRLTGNCKQLYLSTLKKLLIICVPIYGFLGLVAPWLFSVFFGKDWIESGYFAQIICVMMIFDFLALPLNSLFYVMKKQKLYMRIQFINTITGIFAVYIGYFFFKTAYISALFYSLNNVLFSLINLFYTFSFSSQNHKI